MTPLRTYGDVNDYARTIGVSVNELFADDAELFEAVDWNDTGLSESYLIGQLADAERIMERCANEMRILRKYGHDIPDELSDEYNAASRRYTEVYWKMS